ncbi:MAG: methionyl-tRNA formyltransferase [bacterium]
MLINIGYFADGPWSHRAFEKIIKDKYLNIKFICVRYDTKDETLKKYSEQYNIAYLKHQDINSQEFISVIKGYNCDLYVSMSFNQIFKNQIINLPRLKTINCHAGKLPYYRGRNILNWALINDEMEFGITVHYMDEGVDTGDIILQKTFEITDQDDYSSLLRVAHKECAIALYETLEFFKSGPVPRLKQNDIDPIGFYCSARIIGDEKINWNQSSRQLFNFIRAICRPGPEARAFLKSKEMKINKAIEVKGAKSYIGVPGTILYKDSNSFLVKTKDTFINIVDYSYDAKFKVGDRFE